MSALLAYVPTDTLVLGTAIFAVIAAAYWFLTRPKPVPPPIILERRDRREKESADDPNKPTAKILFASQTGTAELFAKTLGKNGKRFGFNTRVVDLLDYDKDQLEQEKIVIFVVSTYGEGEPPDGAKDFYDWFLDLKDGDLDLSGVTFMVFGLGDSQYKLFNHIGKRTEKQMKVLGAKLVYTRGIGDADKTLEEDFENWQAEAWPALAGHLGVTYEETEEVIPVFEPQTVLEVFPEESGVAYRFPSPGGREPAARFPVYAPVLRNDELLQVADRSTKHMELDISAFPRLSYEAGDHLAIYAANPPELVDQYLGVLDLQGHSADTVFVLKSKKGPVTVPKCTLREALTWHYDLGGHPKKELLKTLSQFAADPVEKERFQGLFKKQDEYKKLAEKLRTVFGWLRKFGSTRVPLHTFLEVMPLQQVRYYSIASDYMLQPKQIDLCYAVVDGGVCTNFLKGLRPGDQVPVYVRRSTFHIPRQPAATCVLVGPGTGVAPFIGFLQRRKALLAKGNTLGDCLFFFGCRNRNEDFLYKDFLLQCEAEGIITKLFVAFSREQERKVYVQHLIAENQDEVWRLLNGKTHFYICGDAKHMARDVEQAVTQIIQTRGEGLQTAQAAEEYLNKMQQESRYLKDVWTTR